nr:MAG TPA: FH (FH), also known as a 'winged helix' [Caudoviricetes sp.]
MVILYHVLQGKIRTMNEIYYYILKHYPHLMMM